MTPTDTITLDGSWIEETRETVMDGFDCGVCLDFGYLDGLGPCPHCDPDGYAEHVHCATQARPQFGLDGADPWADSPDLVWVRS
ncbi:MAG: hypothetical protein GEV10_06465 [Streptosporangiales bacterium]|nr:hypothetical protein [Streptosporangiales bacterium]